MISEANYIKTLLEEQDKISKELNFPTIEVDFYTYKISIGMTDNKDISSNILNSVAFTKTFISRLVSSWSTMDRFSNDNIIYFINDIKPINHPVSDLFGLTEISIATKVRLSEIDFIIVQKNIPEFISYYSGVAENTSWFNKHLFMTMDIEEKNALTLPCWYVDFYRKLLIGEKLLENNTFGNMNKLISNINKEIYTNGDCLRFASLFKFKFGRDAVPLWATKKNDLDVSHVFTYLYGKFYDANGSYDYNELIKDWILEYPKIDRSLESNEFSSVFNYCCENISRERLLDIIKE